MAGSVGQVAIDIVMGKNTVTNVVKSAMSDCQKVISDTSASMASKVSAVGNAMQKVGGAIMPMSAVAIGAGVAIGKMSMDFEDAMAKVDTIADTTQVPLDELQKQIIELSNETGIASTEIADNVYNAISAGQQTGDAVNFVANSTKLAKAGFADAGASLDVLTTILNSYGMEASEVTRVSDILIQTQNKGKTTVAELSAYMGKVIPTANAYGVNLENVATNYAIMTAKGIATAESTTYMNSMFNELGKSSTGVSKELQKLTGKSFKELMESGMSVGDVLMILKDECDRTGTQFSDLWSSAEAGKAALVLTQEGAAGFNQMLGTMQNSAGSTDAAFSKMETSSYTMQKAFNTLKNTGIELGDTLMQTLGPMIEGLSKGVSDFAKWFSGLDDGAKKAIVSIGLVVAAAGPLLVIGGKIATGIGSIMKLGGSIGGAIGKLGSSAAQAAGGMSTAAQSIGNVGSAASKAAPAANSAAGGMSKIVQAGLGMLAAGAGILLAGAGLWVIADASIKLAAAGWPAVACMVGMVGALVGLGAGAAAIGAPLTAAAVGLLAFGATVLMIGAGIGIASAGMAMLAEQLPVVVEFGLQAAINLYALGGAAIMLGAGLLNAAAGVAVLAGAALALGAALLVAASGAAMFSVGMLAATVGVLAFSVGMLALSATTALLGASLTLCASNLTTIASALVPITVLLPVLIASTTVLLPVLALLDALLLATGLELAGVTLALGLTTVALGIATVAMGVCAVAAGALGIALGVLGVSFGAFSAVVQPIIQGVQTFVTTAFNTISSVAQSVWNGMIGIVSGAVSAIRNAITTAFSAVRDFVSSVFNGIKNTMSSAFSGMANIGWNLVQGIWNGISGAAGWLMGQIQGFAANVIGSIKGAFGIHSPSRVMRDQVGAMIGEGIAVGIDESAKSVAGSAAGLASSASAAAQDAVSGISTEMAIRTAVEPPRVQSVDAGTTNKGQIYTANDRAERDDKTGIENKLNKIIEILSTDSDTPIQVVVDGRIVDEYMVSRANRAALRSGRV